MILLGMTLLLVLCDDGQETALKDNEQSTTPSTESKEEPSENEKTRSNIEENVDDKKWSDVTKLDHNTKYDFPTNVKDYIAYEYSVFQTEPEQDSKLIEAGYDKYYYYYLEASGMNASLNIIKVKGGAMQKDFNNLKKLTEIIIEEHGKRYENIELGEYDKRDEEERRQAVEEMKAPSERMKKAVEYTKKLLHDLNMIINEENENNLLGYTHQADGTKKTEINKFIGNN